MATLLMLGAVGAASTDDDEGDYLTGANSPSAAARDWLDECATSGGYRVRDVDIEMIDEDGEFARLIVSFERRERHESEWEARTIELDSTFKDQGLFEGWTIEQRAGWC